MPAKFLTALPVYNEEAYVEDVLDEVLRYSRDVLVVDDGSTDDTPERLRRFPSVKVLTHSENRGYGAALRTAFRYALEQDYEVLVTIDCDGQHEPALIPAIVEAAEQADIVSGSRYLETFDPAARPPEDRRRINQTITDEINARLGLKLTDAFCGFKAYRVGALKRLQSTDDGYAMPLELWVQAAKQDMRIREFPVPLVYLDEHRSFGGALDDAATRLAHYRDCIERALHCVDEHGKSPSACAGANSESPSPAFDSTATCEKACP